MVLPMDGGAGSLMMEPPAVVREVHSIFWWILFWLVLGMLTIQVMAASLFQAIYSCLVAYIVWYMVRDSCKEMSPYSLLITGCICFIQGLLDTVILLSMIGGRREQTLDKTHFDKENNEATYRIVVKTHPFFDESQGMVYNLQSLSRLLSPFVMIFATVIAYKSYQAFEREFSVLGGEGGAFGVGAFGGYGGMGGAGGGGGGGAAWGGGGQRLGAAGGGGAAGGRPAGGPAGGPGAASPGGASFAPFGGQGQRLGNDSA